MSSQHTQPTIAPSGKPDIIESYNGTRGGVDTFDQMCARYTCSRKTKRWPLCIMYGLVNAAVVNSYVICNEMRKRDGQTELSRREYLIELAEEMIRPWAEERMSFKWMHRSTLMTIRTVFGFNIPICKRIPLL